MKTSLEQQNYAHFVDRRSVSERSPAVGPERRQFSASVHPTRPEIAELSAAVDQYKLSHRRRFITHEEFYDIIVGLGYHK
ncbi:MAG: hypothetical protein NTW75_12535 [Planctomycetales bacterium]|jgi:hypothetical protein|nr:hypothetical protein [Planctomycetales bacterium]